MEHKAEARALQSLMNLAGGCVVSRCTHVVAELGVADAFDGSPLSAAELADAVGANPTALYRVMSLRAGHGLYHAPLRAHDGSDGYVVVIWPAYAQSADRPAGGGRAFILAEVARR